MRLIILIIAGLFGAIAVVAEPVEKSNVVPDAPGGGLQIVGDKLYIAAWGHGFHVLDISNPTHLKWIGGWNNHTSPTGVYVVGDYAYLANRTSGFDVMDVQNPANPLQVGHLFTGGDAQSVYVAGQLAYVADLRRGLDVIDIKNPSKPELVGDGDTKGQAFHVQVSKGFAYVSYGGEGLRVFDLTETSKPKPVSKCRTGSGGSFQLLGDMVYFSGADGLCRIDIKTPELPEVRDTYRIGCILGGIYVSGRYAYVPLEGDGLHILDISDSTRSLSIGFLKTGYNGWDVRVVGSYAYLMDRGANLHVIDISNPANPIEVSRFGTFNFCSKVLSLTNFVASKSALEIQAGVAGAITDAPPQLADVMRVADGAFSFTLRGVPEGVYYIQASTDLISWTNISTNALPAGGTLRISDADAHLFNNRFYRATKKQ